jgi:hypothetical protein
MYFSNTRTITISIYVSGLYDALDPEPVLTILKNFIPSALYSKIYKYVTSDPCNIRTTIHWESCKKELDKLNLTYCSDQLVLLFNNHIPNDKNVKIFHINNNHILSHISEPSLKFTRKMVFKFYASIYQRNILASIIKYILLKPIIQTFESSQLMPHKRGVFYLMHLRICEIIFECVLVAFNGSNYDNYLICNDLITIQTYLNGKIKLFKKGSSISTIISTNTSNIGRYLTKMSNKPVHTKNKKRIFTVKNKWTMKLFIKDVRNLVAANMSLDKTGKLFNLPVSKLCFPYEQATSIKRLKELTSLKPENETFWKDTFSGKTVPLENRVLAQQIFESQKFNNLYEFSVHYLVQDCVLLHSVLLTLFNSYLNDSINIFIRRNYSQSSLSYQQFFIVEPSKQINKVLAPKTINNTFYNYLFKQAVTGGLCTSFVHGKIDKNTIINEHFNYLPPINLDPKIWPNFYKLPTEWKNIFNHTPSGISTIDIRSLYPSASVKKLPVSIPLFYSRFTQEDFFKLYPTERFYRTLNLKLYCQHVRNFGNTQTDIMKLISKPPYYHDEFNALNVYLSTLPPDITIIRFQSNFTAFGQLTFVKYPVDGLLTYRENLTHTIHVKIIQYHSLYFHGHKSECYCSNNAEEETKAAKTRLVSKHIIELCHHFTEHFRSFINPIYFELVEIFDCDFYNHSVPKTEKQYLPFYHSNYTYNQFLNQVDKKKLTGLLVVRNLKIAKKNQNPIFGFIIQKIEYGFSKLSPYSQQQVSKLSTSKRVVSVHESKEFIVISTEYFNWLQNTFGFESQPDIYHALIFQLDDYLRSSIESKLLIRKSLKKLIQTETDLLLKQKYEIQSELIKLMLNSCYGYTLCNLNSTKFKQFVNRSRAPNRNKRYINIKSCFEMSKNVFLVEIKRSHPQEFTTMLGHVGCYILFHSKIILSRRLLYMIKFLDPRFVQLLYMDTDSAHFLVKFEKFEDNVDPSLKNNFLKFYNKHFETGPKISGIWVKEGFFEIGEYLGEKSYRLYSENEQNNEVIHMKGLNQHFQNLYKTLNIQNSENQVISYNNFFKSPDFLIFKTHMSKDLFRNFAPNKRYFVYASGSLPLKFS